MAAAAALVLVLAEGHPTEDDLRSRAELDEDVAGWIDSVGDWPIDEQGALLVRELCIKAAYFHLAPSETD